MPGRLLPPHQTCPLPLLSLRLSLTMIHTQRESSSCLFFSVYSLSLLLNSSPPDTNLLVDAHKYPCVRTVYEHMENLQPHFATAFRTCALVTRLLCRLHSQELRCKGTLCDRDVASLLCIIILMSCPPSFYVPS